MNSFIVVYRYAYVIRLLILPWLDTRQSTSSSVTVDRAPCILRIFRHGDEQLLVFDQKIHVKIDNGC